MEKVRIIVTARAVIIKEGKILLVKNKDSTLWFTPGGWLDGFEKLEETCKREVYEELGIEVNPIKLLKIDYFQMTAKQNIKWKEAVNKIEHYFLCDIIKGEIKSDEKDNNLWEDADTGNTFKVKFFDKQSLQNLNFAPKWTIDLL